MNIVEASVSVGTVVGTLLSSYVLKAIGPVYIVLVMAALNVIAYSYSDVFLNESLSETRQVRIIYYFV